MEEHSSPQCSTDSNSQRSGGTRHMQRLLRRMSFHSSGQRAEHLVALQHRDDSTHHASKTPSNRRRPYGSQTHAVPLTCRNRRIQVAVEVHQTKAATKHSESTNRPYVLRSTFRRTISREFNPVAPSPRNSTPLRPRRIPSLVLLSQNPTMENPTDNAGASDIYPVHCIS